MNEEFWWDALNEFFVNYAYMNDLEEENYLGKVFLVVVDEEDLDLESNDSLRIKNNTTFDEINKFEPWIGKEEVDEWKKAWSELTSKDKSSQLELLLYSDEWSYVCSLKITKEQIKESLEEY